MSSDNTSPSPKPTNGVPVNGTATAPVEEPGLPPVKPPSGRFIAQLFLVPGLIVAVLVLIYLVGNYLVAERRDRDYFLTNLDSANSDIRWRAAHDLAQVLQRPESLDMASDPVFALGLADRLRLAWLKLKQDEESTLIRMADIADEGAKKREWKKLSAQQNQVSFLISALGGFVVPASAPILCDIANEDKTDATTSHLFWKKANALRRRQAVWALGNLGENRKRFQELTEIKREKIYAALKEEKKKKGHYGEWATMTLLHLREKRSLGVDVCLDKVSRADDPFLRRLAAHSLNFWFSPLAEQTLLRLSRDDGHGTMLKITEEDQ